MAAELGGEVGRTHGCNGHLVQEQWLLSGPGGRVQRVEGIAPVVLLADLLQDLGAGPVVT